MICEKFDEVIKTTFEQYGSIGVDVKLLSVKDLATPSNDWYTVVVEVTPVVGDPHPRADTWHYGGLISHTSGPLPLGIRPIDKDKLLEACKAAKKLPAGFSIPEASCELYWPLYPTVEEPGYVFHYEKTVCVVGAYTGDLECSSG